jgi:hypothetical protein
VIEGKFVLKFVSIIRNNKGDKNNEGKYNSHENSNFNHEVLTGLNTETKETNKTLHWGKTLQFAGPPCRGFSQFECTDDMEEE